MQEYELKILEQYELQVTGTRKTRGAFFCDTEQGLFLLKEAGISEKRVSVLFKLEERMKEAGYLQVDQIFPNREGNYISVSEEGGKYLLKHWFPGRECDIRRNREIYQGIKNLARIHLIMESQEDEVVPHGMHLAEVYARHSKELRKVRQFVRRRTVKDAFELQFLKEFEKMYMWTDIAQNELEHSGYERLYQESIDGNKLVHGEYNYHNILMTEEGIATTNFEKFHREIQVEDLYYFLRKVMEKHGWNSRLCDGMLNAYSAIRPIRDAEMEYLKIRFLYPEKFWKIAGSYYRSNKAWISVKNVEKFQTVITQTEEKKRLLQEVFGF